MEGQMVWFNEERGDGLIRSANGESYAVAADGFLLAPPAGRCGGRPVTFSTDDAGRAVGVVLLEDDAPRRARMRSQRGARS